MLLFSCSLFYYAGFDANTLLKSDWTGLMYACDAGHQAIVKLLLSYGANPNYIKGMCIYKYLICNSIQINN